MGRTLSVAVFIFRSILWETDCHRPADVEAVKTNPSRDRGLRVSYFLRQWGRWRLRGPRLPGCVTGGPLRAVSHSCPPPPVPREPGGPTRTSLVCDQGDGAGSGEIVGKVPNGRDPCYELATGCKLPVPSKTQLAARG